MRVEQYHRDAFGASLPMRMTASRFWSSDLPDNKVVARLIKRQPRLRLAARSVSTRQPSSFRCASDSRPDTLRRCRHAAVRPQPILRRHGF